MIGISSKRLYYDRFFCPDRHADPSVLDNKLNAVATIFGRAQCTGADNA
jgi:hypothetical protein